MPAHSAAQRELAELIGAQGHRVVEIPDGPLSATADSVLLLAGNANWYPQIRRQLLRTGSDERPWLVVWHGEPLPPPKASGLRLPRLSFREWIKILLRDPRVSDPYSNLLGLRRLARRGLPDLLIGSSRGRCESLGERGIAAEWVPVGCPAGERPLPQRERDIDVLFLGDLRVPRRRRLLPMLRRGGVDVRAAGDFGDPALWGEPRRALLSRTKILLNLSRFPGELAGSRFVLGMRHGALVVSEPIYRPEPFVPGEHFVSVPADRMAEAVGYYLRREGERRRLAVRAGELVARQLMLERSVSKVLALIERRVAAPRVRA